MKKGISKKIKVINNKIGQYKAQYDWDKQTAKPWGNVISKYEFLNGKDVLFETGLLEKVEDLNIFR